MNGTRSLSVKTLFWGKSFVLLTVALIFLGWLWNTPPGLLGKADAVGFAVCHRIDSRSFHLGERQLPLCVRCSGMYLGAMLALAYQGAYAGRRGGMPGWKIWIVMGVFTLAFALDGLNSYLHLFPGFRWGYEPQNWLRLLTGSGMGLVMGLAVVPAFNQTVWAAYDPQPVMSRWRELAGLVLLTLALDAVVLTENPLILYPMALVSAAGVVILLSTIYAMLWLIIMRRENRFHSFSELLIPLAMGFGLALIQVGGLDWVRYLLTGSWEGFHLG